MGIKQTVPNQRRDEAHAYANAVKKLVESRRSGDIPEDATSDSADASDLRRTETPALLRPKQTRLRIPVPAGYNPYFDLPPDRPE